MFNLRVSWSGPLIGPTPLYPGSRSAAFRGTLFRGSPQPLVIVHNSVLLLSSVSPSLSQSDASILGEPSGWPRADAERRHHSSAATVPVSFSRPPPHPLHLLLLFALPVSLSNRVLTLSLSLTPPFQSGLATSPLSHSRTPFAAHAPAQLCLSVGISVERL